MHTHLISAEHVIFHGAPPGTPASDAEDLIDRLDEANVERAVVLSTAYVGPEEAMSAENDWVAAEIAKFPDRLSGFCGINPLHVTAVEEIGRCLDLPTMMGVKLHLSASEVDMTNEDHVAALSAVFDEIQERDAPALIDVATPLGLALDTDGLTNLAIIVAMHPEMRLVLAHCTSEVDSELIELWIRSGFDNIYSDVSACLKFYRDAPFAKRELMVWRLKKFGLERVFLGSDYLMVEPIETPKEALETLSKYPFTQEEIDIILDNDASAWLFGP
jgi:predicted TIM-barrel fold metal-dependent hydrolase